MFLINEFNVVGKHFPAFYFSCSFPLTFLPGGEGDFILKHLSVNSDRTTTPTSTSHPSFLLIGRKYFIFFLEIKTVLRLIK